MIDQSEKWTGGCLCGAITYVSNGSPGKNSGYCHCRMCQRAYGNGFTAFIEFPAETSGLHVANQRFTDPQMLAREVFALAVVPQ